MRNIKRQLQDVWFCKSSETQSGLSLVKVFSNPTYIRASVSATAGSVAGGGTGLVLNYDRYITSFDRNLYGVIDESYYAFIDVTPELADDGSLVLEDDGITPTTEPDYRVYPIYDTKMGRVARYGLVKVGGKHDN